MEPDMRCFYLDPGLRYDLGHHANFCRYITGALRQRGIETAVLGHRTLTPALCDEFRAQPHFRVHTYQISDGDPISGWLSGFDLTVRLTLEDLAQLPPMTSSDLVYLSTARPAQLLAVTLWQRGLPDAARPCLVVEVNETGLVGRRDGDAIHFDAPEPRDDARPLLFRFVGRRHLHPLLPRTHFISFDPANAACVGQLIGAPVETAPLPYRAVAPLRSRAGAAPVTVAALGHQTAKKGYPLLPELIRTLLARRAEITCLVQTVHIGDQGAAEATEALGRLAAAEPRLLLDDQPAGAERWPSLLGQTDLLLCPYRAEGYACNHSSMACEALANAIPIVAPAGSTMEKLLHDCGDPGLTFARHDLPTILAAAEAVLDQFDLYAERAYRAALAWPQTRGPDRLAEYLIALASRAAA